MIPADGLIAMFNRMYREKWAYKWGAAQTGCVDCAGAFVWAYRQYGQSIYHGSNRIARRYIVELLPISQARPGMAAFKVRKPGTEYYDLKAEYKPGGEYYNGNVDDFYHIGLVDTDTRYVLNAQSTKTGFVRSEISQNWAYVARLKAVEYPDTEGNMSDIKYVWAPTGDSVYLRPRASTNANYICKVPIGSQVEVLGTTSTGWSGVRYGEKTGYMMNQFLVDALPGEDAGQQTAQESTVDQTRAALYAAREAIDKALLLLSPAG